MKEDKKNQKEVKVIPIAREKKSDESEKKDWTQKILKETKNF